jgi:hypothetical protein
VPCWCPVGACSMRLELLGDMRERGPVMACPVALHITTRGLTSYGRLRTLSRQQTSQPVSPQQKQFLSGALAKSTLAIEHGSTARDFAVLAAGRIVRRCECQRSTVSTSSGRSAKAFCMHCPSRLLTLDRATPRTVSRPPHFTSALRGRGRSVTNANPNSRALHQSIAVFGKSWGNALMAWMPARLFRTH